MMKETPRFQHSFNLSTAMQDRLRILVEKHGVKIIDIIKVGIEELEKKKNKK